MMRRLGMGVDIDIVFVLALTTVPNVNPPTTEMALKRRKTSRKMVSSLGRETSSVTDGERERDGLTHLSTAELQIQERKRKKDIT